jgi:exonuclease SbcC
MNPVQIKLSNFTSYKDETVNLEGIDIAVATGENGAGKSSLVTDAITWCLFGEGSKGGKKALNDYVKRGEQECRVEIQFMLGREIYRVVRHRSAAKDKTLLEFFVQEVDGDSGVPNWVARSGKGIAETQEIIEKTLRMDYRTFTSSSLILQGKADSFSSDMTDAERKEALARILGLDIWDQLQEKVKQQLKDLNGKLSILAGKKTPLAAKVNSGAETKKLLDEAQREHSGIQSNLNSLKNQMVELNKKLASETALQSSLKDNEGLLQQKKSELSANVQEITTLKSKNARLKTILENKEKVDKALEDEKALTQEITVLEVEVGKKQLLADQLKEAHSALSMGRQDKSKLEMDQADYDNEVAELNNIILKKGDIQEACEQEKELQEELQGHEVRSTEHSDFESKITVQLGEVNNWDSEHKSRISGLESSIEAKKPMIATLHSVPCGDDLKSSCKLLASARTAAEEIKNLTIRLEEEQAEVNPHKAQYDEQCKMRDAIGYNKANHTACKNLLTEVQKTSSLKPRLDAAESRKKELTKMLADIKDKLSTINLDELQRKYTEVYNLLSGIDEKETLLSNKKAALTEAQKITKLKSELDNAAGVLPELKESLSKAEQKDHQLNDEICTLEEKINALKDQIDDLAIVRLKADGLSGDIGQAETKAAELQKSIGRYEQNIEDVKKDEKDLNELELQEKDLRKDISTYEMLEQACGKKSGVPALIIENAVPEIERLANDLLNRVAGGRLQVRLDTQIEGKSTGAMQDVLRITVLDEGLPGPYQTFSGAERFIIDISLRVAISKFLSHRAGAEIKLLVIDEGFGSLDASGRQRILSAIEAIRQDFAKVIIITHLEELKDAFPRRIEVTKGPEGSKVNVA